MQGHYNRDDYYWSMDVNLSDYWYDNTAYCRLKNVVLNYTLTSDLTEAWVFQEPTFMCRVTTWRSFTPEPRNSILKVQVAVALILS